MLKLISIVILTLLISCTGGSIGHTSVPTHTPTTTPPPTTTPATTTQPFPITSLPLTKAPTTTTSPSLTTPTMTLPPATTPAPLSTVIFDFDTGVTAVPTGSNSPFSQSSGGLTAHFSSPSDPAAFSIQNHDTTFFTLSQFSGNYLYQNKSFRTHLHITFSQPLTKISLTFVTTDYHGVGEVDEPTAIKLTAYMNTIETASVGSAVARGNFSDDAFPKGRLSFDSVGYPFNLVVIELLYQPMGGTSFFIDNILVTLLP